MELNIFSIHMHPFKVHACTVLCRVGEVIGSRIIWMHLELCTSCTCIYYIYMVCIRVEPAIFEKRGNYRRGSRGDRGSGSLELSKYTSQRTTFQDFRCYQGVTLYANFKIFRPPPPFACYHIYLEWKYMYYDPSLPFNDFADCLGNFKVVHRSYTFYTQTTFICKNPDLYILYSNTPQLKWKCQSTKISWGQSLIIKDLHRFIKHFVIKYHGIIWNSEGGNPSKV